MSVSLGSRRGLKQKRSELFLENAVRAIVEIQPGSKTTIELVTPIKKSAWGIGTALNAKGGEVRLPC